MSNFLTVEDINTTVYSNQGFYWHTIDFNKFPSVDFTNIKYDFCEITRETVNNDPIEYHFYIKIDNPNWTLGVGSIPYSHSYDSETNTLHIITYNSVPDYQLKLYMGNIPFETKTILLYNIRGGNIRNLNYKELNTPQSIKIHMGSIEKTVTLTLQQGYNYISTGNAHAGYLLVNLVKSDFQFNCTQTLKLGQVNHVALGTHTDYKPSGAMIGAYTPTIKINYNNQIITAEYDTDDYYFNLDLTDIAEPGKIKFKVIIETNDVINHTETDVTLNCDYETITTLTRLTDLFTNGGIAKLGANITLTSDLTISNNNVLLIGNNKTINGNLSYGIIVNTDKIFKAENTIFNEMERGILQKTSSTVELTGCTFTNCKSCAESSMGSCICCEIDQDSLENPNDYITILTGCTFTNNFSAILHGGELTINDCEINITDGGVFTPYNPIFLYQTDGEAEIINSSFNLEDESRYSEDLMFAPALFICGETATINGLDHTRLQDNNLTGFLEYPYNNRSSIDLTYHYDVIDEDVHLTSSNGYCHGVSGVDYLFKTNVTLTRSG